MNRTLILAGLLLLARPAFADKSDRADKLFQKGKKLLAEKKYADACPAFEQSDKLDPGIGAKLNTAKCYEDWGRLATAYRWYEDAAKMAAQTKDDRGAKIKALMAELDDNVPRLTIRVPEGADPDVLATITLDDKPVESGQLNTELRIDPGPHAIELRVDGKKRKKMAPVERGGESEITLDVPKGEGTAPRAPATVGQTSPPSAPSGTTAPLVAPASPGRTRRIAGITVASAGVVAVGIAGVITLGAKSKYKDALAANCMGSTTMCDETGLAATRDARHTANVATVVTLIGTAAIIGGVVLYLTAPTSSATKRGERASTEDAMYLAPVLDANGGGFAVVGSF